MAEPPSGAKESDPPVSTKISSDSSVEMGDYVSVIRRRKLLIAAMTLAGLALALFYSVVLATPSYVSHAKVQVRPIRLDCPPAPDKLIVMGTERELARPTTSPPSPRTG